MGLAELPYRIARTRITFERVFWAAMALLLLAGLYESFGWVFTSEDIGQRLRRECESIIRAAGVPSGYQEEYALKNCILSRGRAG